MNIKQCILGGQLPPGLRILDAHAHLNEGEKLAAYVCTLPHAESLQLSRAIGIGAMVASALRAFTVDAVSGNDRIMELTHIYPGYVYASIVYVPAVHNAILQQLERYREDPGFVGIKIHPRDTDTSIKSGDYDRLFAYCQDRNILVACHTWQTEPQNDPADFWEIMKRFPALKLQLCHMGGTYRGCMESLALANDYKTVYLDINGSLYSQIWLEELVKQAPIGQFVFGTDQTFNDPCIMVGRVLLSDLTDEQKQLLLCDNFETIIGRKLIL